MSETQTEHSHDDFQYPSIIPYLTLSDATAALDWYKKVFAAEVPELHHAQDGKRIMHATVLMAGGVVMICDEFPEFNGGKKQNPAVLGGSGVTVQVLLPNVDEVWEKAVAAGAKVEMPLADQFWGDRYGVIADPFGHRWALFTHKPKPAEIGQTW